MTRREPRWWFVAYSFGLGLIIAVAALAGDKPWLAGFAVPWLTLFGVGLAFTPFGRMRPSSLDERETSVGKEAVTYMAYAMVLVVAGGWLVTLAQGDPAPEFTLVGGVGGFSYLIALAVLQRRR